MNDLKEQLALAAQGDPWALHALREVAIETSDHTLRVQVARLRAASQPELLFDERTESTLVKIPGGPTRLTRYRTQAHIPTFYLCEHPITNRQFATFLEETGYQPAPGYGDLVAYWGDDAPYDEELDHPVLFVNALDALHYCRWARMWLPTEWMWEKAASGPHGHTLPWTGGLDKDLLHIDENSTCHVEDYREITTAYGCQNMLGNVSE